MSSKRTISTGLGAGRYKRNFELKINSIIIITKNYKRIFKLDKKKKKKETEKNEDIEIRDQKRS